MKLSDLDIHDIGTVYQITGVVISGRGTHYVAHFPDEHSSTDRVEPYLPLVMDGIDWEKFLYQSDVLNVFELDAAGQKKALVRKSQRQIDTNVSWAVFKRDGYRCRYCGKEAPLTVDHIILWEMGGPSTTANLVAACKKCNRTRGNMPYADWLQSEAYKRASRDLSSEQQERNHLVLSQLEVLERSKVAHVRSR